MRGRTKTYASIMYLCYWYVLFSDQHERWLLTLTCRLRAGHSARHSLHVGRSVHSCCSIRLISHCIPWSNVTAVFDCWHLTRQWHMTDERIMSLSIIILPDTDATLSRVPYYTFMSSNQAKHRVVGCNKMLSRLGELMDPQPGAALLLWPMSAAQVTSFR